MNEPIAMNEKKNSIKCDDIHFENGSKMQFSIQKMVDRFVIVSVRKIYLI